MLKNNSWYEQSVEDGHTIVIVKCRGDKCVGHIYVSGYPWHHIKSACDLCGHVHEVIIPKRQDYRRVV